MQFRREKKAGPTVSLQETIDAGKEDSALTLSDLLQDSACMEENVEQKDDAQRLRALIETLPARERQSKRCPPGSGSWSCCGTAWRASRR